MKKIVITIIVALSMLSANAQYPSYEPERSGAWLWSYTFFPEVQRQGWGLHYINLSSSPALDRGLFQFSVDYDPKFLENANRARWNMTYGHHYAITRGLMTYWSLGPGLKYDIYRYPREGKDKWYQRKYDRDRIDWKGAAVADIGVMFAVPIVEKVITLIVLAEEEVWYEFGGEGFYQMPKVSAIISIGFGR